MFAEERHSLIKKIVRENQRMNFAELQGKVKVSPATLRRDLAGLEQSGDLIRVHGGVLHPSYARSEISFDERLHRNNAAKKAIALKTASLIPPGSSVFVDAGSTCLEAGKILLRRKDIRLITHSVALLAEALHGEASVLCVGGELRQVSGALTGGNTLGSLASIQSEFALLGASGLNEEGLWTTELSEAEIKQAIISRTRRVLLLADSTKWGTASTVRFAPWEKVTDWVTEGKLARRAKDGVRSGLRIHMG